MTHAALLVVRDVGNEAVLSGDERQASAARVLRNMSAIWGRRLAGAPAGDVQVIAGDITGIAEHLLLMRDEIIRRHAGRDDLVCAKCGSALRGDYCSDVTCPYSDWPQRIPLSDLESMGAEDIARRHGVSRRVVIEARVHDDLLCHDVWFDAVPWFMQASDEAILDLYEEGWERSEAADAVAEFFESRLPEVARLFAYCRDSHAGRLHIGFQCEVDRDSAMVWLRQNRPGVWATLLCYEKDVSFIQAEEEEVAGMWDWMDHDGSPCDRSFFTMGEAALDAVAKLRLS